MSIIAKQSTARTVIVGPILDADGVAVTDAAVGDLKISKNGGAPAGLNGSATLTHRNTGHYSLALTTSDTDTVGQAEIVIDDTVNAMPVKPITIVEEAVYDALFAASAAGKLGVNVIEISDSATAADNLEAAADGTGYNLGNGYIVAASVTADVTTDAASRTASQADVSALATASALATVDANVDAILVDTGTTLPGTLSTIDGKIDTIDTNVDAILVDTDVTIPGLLTIVNGKIDVVDGIVDDILVDTGTTIPGTITTIDTVVDAIQVVTDKLDTSLELDGAVYRYTTNALEQGPSGGGGGDATEAKQDEIIADIAALSVGTGGGATLRTNAGNAYTDGSNPIEDGVVEITPTSGGSVIARDTTDSNGLIGVYLDAGTYTATFTKSGFTTVISTITATGTTEALGFA